MIVDTNVWIRHFTGDPRYVDAYLLGYAEYSRGGPVVTFDRELKRRAESVGVRLLDE